MPPARLFNVELPRLPTLSQPHDQSLNLGTSWRMEGDTPFSASVVLYQPDSPTLRHVSVDEREILPDQFKNQRRLEYGRLLRKNVGTPVPHARTTNVAFRVPSRQCQTKAEIISWQFMDITDLSMMETKVPEGSKRGLKAPTSVNKRYIALQKAQQERREKLKKAPPEGAAHGPSEPLDSTRPQSDRKNPQFDRKKSRIQVIKAGDKEYAYSSEYDNKDGPSLIQQQLLSMKDEEELAGQDFFVHQYQGFMVKLNNNKLVQIDCLGQTITRVCYNHIQCIDLSCNKIMSLPEGAFGPHSLLPHLVSLLLHSNDLSNDTITPLYDASGLRNLSLFGNRRLTNYKFPILFALSELRNLDFAIVTEVDRQSAEIARLRAPRNQRKALSPIRSQRSPSPLLDT